MSKALKTGSKCSNQYGVTAAGKRIKKRMSDTRIKCSTIPDTPSNLLTNGLLNHVCLSDSAELKLRK
nr:MAG TPA: hypothetical protein [Caudoviricetes sp.]